MSNDVPLPVHQGDKLWCYDLLECPAASLPYTLPNSVPPQLLNVCKVSNAVIRLAVTSVHTVDSLRDLSTDSVVYTARVDPQPLWRYLRVSIAVPSQRLIPSVEKRTKSKSFHMPEALRIPLPYGVFESNLLVRPPVWCDHVRRDIPVLELSKRKSVCVEQPHGRMVSLGYRGYSTEDTQSP